jgi:hypothetical protein
VSEQDNLLGFIRKVLGGDIGHTDSITHPREISERVVPRQAVTCHFPHLDPRFDGAAIPFIVVCLQSQTDSKKLTLTLVPQNFFDGIFEGPGRDWSYRFWEEGDHADLWRSPDLETEEYLQNAAGAKGIALWIALRTVLESLRDGTHPVYTLRSDFDTL